MLILFTDGTVDGELLVDFKSVQATYAEPPAK